MDPQLLFKALVLGVVEGLTEFLPISSTGHLILASHLLGLTDERSKAFDIVIQTGAILAVVWEFRARFARVLGGLATSPEQRRFALNVVVAFLPAALLGLAGAKLIKRYLFHPIPVALAFLAGALVILWAERRKSTPRVTSVDDLQPPLALQVGLAQCFALLPGMSRSGATIIGGMLLGLSRKAATEFSFFLAVPTLVAAAAYDLLKHRDDLHASDAPMFAVGFAAAFVSAFACVRWLLRFVATHDFVPFAWYRIVFGVVVLATWALGWVQWSAG